jgi:hypothetical protein
MGYMYTVNFLVPIPVVCGNLTAGPVGSPPGNGMDVPPLSLSVCVCMCVRARA